MNRRSFLTTLGAALVRAMLPLELAWQVDRASTFREQIVRLYPDDPRTPFLQLLDRLPKDSVVIVEDWIQSR